MVRISYEFYKYNISILYSGKDETKSKDGIENVKQEIDDSKKLVKCFFVVLHIFDNSLSLLFLSRNLLVKQKRKH